MKKFDLAWEESMKSSFKTFAQPIERNLIKKWLGLPRRSVRNQFQFQNHDYEPIRSTWKGAKEVLELENSLLKRLELASDFPKELDVIADELYEDPEHPFLGLDIGVAGAVLTLAAMKCVTLSSCNGGALGDCHHESHPLVVFYAERDQSCILLEAAAKAEVGMSNEDGPILVWANDIRHLHNFAVELHNMRKRH